MHIHSHQYTPTIVKALDGGVCMWRALFLIRYTARVILPVARLVKTMLA